MSERLTPEEIQNVNDYQLANCWHPMTCGNDSQHALLVATAEGMHCPDCDWKQTRIYEFVRSGLWRERAAKMDAFRSAVGRLQLVRKPSNKTREMG